MPDRWRVARMDAGGRIEMDSASKPAVLFLYFTPVAAEVILTFPRFPELPEH
jgi:hypothetical protein